MNAFKYKRTTTIVDADCMADYPLANFCQPFVTVSPDDKKQLEPKEQ